MSNLFVEYVAVCDDLRLEKFNKVSLMGFLGLLPKVKIGVEKTPSTIRTTLLASFNSTTKSSGDIVFELFSPKNEKLLSQAFDGVVTSPNQVFNLVVSLSSLHIESEGRYKVNILWKSESIFSEYFTVTPAPKHVRDEIDALRI